MRELFDKLVPATGPRTSIALLLLRIVVGASFIGHGGVKLAHPMSWDGPHGPLPGVPGALQLIIALAEGIGGWFIIAGLLTPLFALIQTVDMFVVVFIVKMAHGLPYVGRGPSFELEAHLLVGALILLLCGPGTYSLDNLLKSMTGSRERRQSMA